MSTNYYAVDRRDVCQPCGHGEKRRHIGKSSRGWCFALHVYPEEGIDTLDDWVNLFTSGMLIEDEAGVALTVREMMDVISTRSWPLRGYTREFLDMNRAEPGPNNLLRARVDGERCIGHGPGTWDYIIGDFS